jgi:hypothetical protein
MTVDPTPIQSCYFVIVSPGTLMTGLGGLLALFLFAFVGMLITGRHR